MEKNGNAKQSDNILAIKHMVNFNNSKLVDRNIVTWLEKYGKQSKLLKI